MWGLLENKKPPRNICKRTLDKGFERDWSAGLGAMLDNGHTENKKKYFSSFRNFPGKIGSVMLWVSNVLKSHKILLKSLVIFWENLNV